MAKKKATSEAPRERDKLPLKTRVLVLTESGYRCAVPTCRTILALDLHHLWEVAGGGGDDPSNLIALCPTCHRLYHQGFIPPAAIYAYKSTLVAIGRAFDYDAVDRLLFLAKCDVDYLIVSGDGVLHFSRLIAAGFADFEQKSNNNWQLVTYSINIRPKGRQFVDAWKLGDRKMLEAALKGPIPGDLVPQR